MQLGFVTAILPELSLAEVLQTAASIGYDCVEAMCWPPGKADRRYAGVTHVDVSDLTEESITHIKDLQKQHGVFISSLGYYPNPLGGEPASRKAAVEHLHRLIDASARLDIHTVTTFVGRDKDRTVEDQWDDFLATWRPLVQHAEEQKVRIGIENCPMRFTADEWPGGNNLATNPAVWERMWHDIPSPAWGLNYDPSHLVLMQMDYTRPFRDYPNRMVHVHAKDLRIDREALDRHGVFAHPAHWHTPKLPGLGDVNWGRFFGHLSDAGYDGPVCVEVEDRAYEGSRELRIRSLQQSHNYLRQYIV